MGSYGSVQVGLMNYVAYLFAMFQDVLGYIFDLTSGRLTWDVGADGQIVLAGNLPELTQKGSDIVAAIMTIVHNGLVAAAEFTTLLPSNALTG